MTAQKTTVQFRNKIYEVTLDNGVVSYADSGRPERKRSFGLIPGQGNQSIENAKQLVLRMIEKRPSPLMTFSD